MSPPDGASAAQNVYELLVESLHAWADELPVEEARTTTIVVSGVPGGLVAVSEDGARRLHWALDRDRADVKAEKERSARIEEMARILVGVRQTGGDAGSVTAEALSGAAGSIIGGVHRLVAGRPGSWEAAIVVEMAVAGGEVRAPDVEAVVALSKLFVAMGEAREDGGDTVSLAWGRTANLLGSMSEFIGDSPWADHMDNLGGQYAHEVADGLWHLGRPGQ